MAERHRGTLVDVKALVCCVVVVAACNGDRYGAYLHVTSSRSMDQIEFVFGGYMPSNNCDHTVTQHAPILRRTPAFPNMPPAEGDTMFRRQPSPGDIRKISGTEYTLYVDDLINDPTTPFDDTLGHTLIVVAKSGQDTLVGELDDFEISSVEVDNYEIPLQLVDNTNLEQWGGGDEGCLRYTRTLPDMTTASEFIVPTWDRDCDGFFTQACYTADGNPIDDDCDPLSFCDVSAPTGACQVPSGCAISDVAGNTDCHLADCENQAGQPHKVCVAETSFCLQEDACDPQVCERPLPECLATQLHFDVECDVSAVKDASGKFDDGTVCDMVGPGPLHSDPAGPTCTIIEAVPLSPTRGIGTTFDTPTDTAGCDLEVIANPTATLPGRISETGLIVNIVSSAPDGTGTLLVDVKPAFVNSCDEAQPPDCHPLDAALAVCKL